MEELGKLKIEPSNFSIPFIYDGSLFGKTGTPNGPTHAE